MAIDEIVYITYEEAVLIHFSLMRSLGEARCGVDFRDLIESALARPRNAAIYARADIIGQAATLLFGLIKNHPWRGGNKRTATTLMRRFLELNGHQKNWTVAEQIELVLAVESDLWKVTEIENWLRPRVRKIYFSNLTPLKKQKGRSRNFVLHHSLIHPSRLTPNSLSRRRSCRDFRF